MELSFFLERNMFPVLYIVSSYYNICNFWSYIKSAKYFSIQTYDFKEINLSDGQSLMIFCSLMKSFKQMLLSWNLACL